LPRPFVCLDAGPKKTPEGGPPSGVGKLLGFARLAAQRCPQVGRWDRSDRPVLEALQLNALPSCLRPA